MNTIQKENIGAFFGLVFITILIYVFEYDFRFIIIPVVSYGITVHIIMNNRKLVNGAKDE